MSLPEVDIGNVLSKAEIFANVASTVSPLSFLTVLHHILSGLAVTPPSGYAPSWEIPFQLQRQGVINIDETIDIDLAQFSYVHDILIVFEVLGFIIFLIFWTFQLLHYMVDIFS